MKLKDIFTLRTVGTDHYLIALADAPLKGMVRLNDTAAFILEQLRQDTTAQQVEQALCQTYGIDAQLAQKDVAASLEKLRSYGALEE